MAEAKSKEPGTEVEKVEELTPDMEARMAELAGETKSAIDLQEDVRLPQLQLVQGQSSNVGDARKGQLFHSLTQDAWNEVEVILVKMFKTRTYWGDQDGLDNPPACTSPNALDGWGDPDEEAIKRDGGEPYGLALDDRGPNGGGSCARCPKNRIAPDGCQLQFNYLAVQVSGDGEEVDMTLPIGFMMKRTSIKRASQLNSLLLDMKYPWSNVIVLASDEEENKASQKYYIWRIKKGRAATMQEMVKAATVAGMISDAQKGGASVTIGDGDEGGGSKSSGDDSDIPF
jgi:hypothetical protein